MCMNTHTYTWPSMGRGAKIGGSTTSRKSNGGSGSTGVGREEGEPLLGGIGQGVGL